MNNSVYKQGSPCKRCLLLASGQEEVLKSIKELISVMPEEERADSELYKRRLDICSGCGELVNGMCMKCGCYIELRAAKKLQRCPHESNKWSGC